MFFKKQNFFKKKIFFKNSSKKSFFKKFVQEARGAVDSGWICEVINDDNSLFYFDTNNFTGHWTVQSDPDFSRQLLLTSDEIRSLVDECSEAFNKFTEWKENSTFLIKIQSMVRMYIQRQKYRHRVEFLRNQETHVTTIQGRVYKIFFFGQIFVQNLFGSKF